MFFSEIHNIGFQTQLSFSQHTSFEVAGKVKVKNFPKLYFLISDLIFDHGKTIQQDLVFLDRISLFFLQPCD